MKQKIKIITIILSIALAISACGAKEQTMVKKEETMAKSQAPAFMFTDFDGNTVSLADFNGKKVYIKFWASWCSACLTSFPETDELSSMDNDFEVITVVAPGMRGEKSKEDFQQWYGELGYKNTTVLFDENATYMDEFEVRAFPSSAYIDVDGSLIDFAVGRYSNDKVKSIFKQ